jgi:hypothetical protein
VSAYALRDYGVTWQDLQERLWLLFDIAQIISNTSNHKQIILCVLCALCG